MKCGTFFNNVYSTLNSHYLNYNTKMKYYHLFVSCEPEVIGVNNGFSQGNIIWNKFNYNESENRIMNYFSINKFIKNNQVIEPIDFTFEYVEAEKKAKMTDFFLFSPMLFGVRHFVTKKVVDLLNNFNLPLHKFIPVNIYQQGKRYEYYAFYIATHYREDSINFSESIFYDGTEYGEKTFVKLDNVEEYRNYKGLKKFSQIKFNENFDTSLDLFDMIWGLHYISEKLKLAIEQAKLTGIVIREPKNPEFILP